MTLQYFHLTESSTATSAVESLDISLHLLTVIAGLQTSKATISMASVAITHGNSGSRQHIWSFGGGFTGPDNPCPCVSGTTIPSFVGEDYFCETGNDNAVDWAGMFFADDPLWDGQDCGTSNTCECTLNNPPWFCKQLPQATTDDIEVRICGDESRSNEDTPVELIELYVR